MKKALRIFMVFGMLVMLSTACASPPRLSHLPEEIRAKTRTVSVVPAAFEPREHFAVKVREASADTIVGSPEEREAAMEKAAKERAAMEKEGSKPVKAANPLLTAAGATAAVSVGMAPLAEAAPLAMNPAVIPVIAGAVVLGAVAYSSNSPLGIKTHDQEQKQRIDKAVVQAYSRKDIHASVADRAVEAGGRLTDIRFVLAVGMGPATEEAKPDYRPLGAAGADLALELRVSDIGFLAFTGESDNDPLAVFFLHAAARVVAVEGSREVYTDSSVYASPKYKLSSWIADDAKLLRSEIEKGRDVVAERLVEKLFLLQEFYAISPWSPDWQCSLDPFYPPRPGIKVGFSRGLTVPRIDSLQPTFRWESFPRDKDRQNDPAGLLAKVGEIGYDIKVWKVKDGYPETLVYERTGIPIAEKAFEESVKTGSSITGEVEQTTRIRRVVEHPIETSLDPQTIYFWSVRARFRIDGRERVTKWAYSRVPFPPSIADPCGSDHIPLTHYYRFETPAK